MQDQGGLQPAKRFAATADLPAGGSAPFLFLQRPCIQSPWRIISSGQRPAYERSYRSGSAQSPRVAQSSEGVLDMPDLSTIRQNHGSSTQGLQLRRCRLRENQLPQSRSAVRPDDGKMY